MSKTPETDKEEYDGNRYKAVSADFARNLERTRDQMRALLIRYRNETPIGNQPHMIASEVDDLLEQPTKEGK